MILVKQEISLCANQSEEVSQDPWGTTSSITFPIRFATMYDKKTNAFLLLLELQYSGIAQYR